MMTTSKTTRLRVYTNHEGLALCGHITLDVTARCHDQRRKDGRPWVAQNFKSDYKPPTRLKHMYHPRASSPPKTATHVIDGQSIDTQFRENFCTPQLRWSNNQRTCVPESPSWLPFPGPLASRAHTRRTQHNTHVMSPLVSSKRP